MTVTAIADRLAVELLLPVFMTYTQPSACKANALTDCDCAIAVFRFVVARPLNISIVLLLRNIENEKKHYLVYNI